jgi:hypothetical protein
MGPAERESREAKERKHRGIKRVQQLAAFLALVNVVVAFALVPILQGAILFASTMVIYAGPFLTWPRSTRLSDFGTELLRSNGVWLAIAAATVIALAWVATPPVDYPLASVYVDGRSKPISGALIDRSADGVYLGRCVGKLPPGAGDDGHPRSTQARIVLIAKDRIRRIDIGGKKYVFDPGARPALGQVVLAGLKGTSAARDFAPLSETLRVQPDRVCGGE